MLRQKKMEAKFIRLMFHAHLQEAFSFLDAIFEIFWIHMILHHHVAEFVSQDFTCPCALMPCSLIQRFPKLYSGGIKACYRKFCRQLAVDKGNQSKIWEALWQANFDAPKYVWLKVGAYSEQLSPAMR